MTAEVETGEMQLQDKDCRALQGTCGSKKAARKDS